MAYLGNYCWHGQKCLSSLVQSLVCVELHHVALPHLAPPTQGHEHPLATHPLHLPHFLTCIHYFFWQKMTVITLKYDVQNVTLTTSLRIAILVRTSY
jgi:hypothetical protein